MPRRALPVLLGLAIALAGCARDRGAEPDADPASFEPWPQRHLQRETLAVLEEGLRARPVARSPERASPRAVARVPGSRMLAGLADGEILLFDPAGERLAHAPAPPRSAALWATAARDILVSAGSAPAIARYRLATAEGQTLERLDDVEVPGATSAGPLAAAGGSLGASWIFVGDAAAGRVRAMDASGSVGLDLGACAPPQSLAATRGYLIAGCGDGAVAIWALDRSGAPSASHPVATEDGGAAIWALAADGRWDPEARSRRGLIFATATGSAEHAAQLMVYRLAPEGALERVAAVELEAHGLVTPTSLGLVQGVDASLRIDVLGTSAARRAAFTWAKGRFDRDPEVRTQLAPPGVVDAVPFAPGYAMATPLLGGIAIDGPSPRFASAAKTDGEARSSLAVIGQAIASTTLITDPDRPEANTACTVCHDGPRGGPLTATGESVLAGRFDGSLADAAIDAFRDANAEGGRRAWFIVRREETPWLTQLAGAPERLSPVYLRYALMSYLDEVAVRGTHPLGRRHEPPSTRSRNGEGLTTEENRSGF